jgi:hypothetical protein
MVKIRTVLEAAVLCCTLVIRMFLGSMTIVNPFCSWDHLAYVRRLGGPLVYKIIPI